MTEALPMPAWAGPALRRIYAERAYSERYRNADFDWDLFNPEWYCAHNYLKLRDDDTAIMRKVGEFFSGALAQSAPRPRGLDVGSGPNLYPAMAMLPFCESVDLREYSRSNVRWLSRQARYYDRHWDQFWKVYQDFSGYDKIGNPRQALAKRARIERASIFHLPEREWDLGTMFFVAESLTRDPMEFWAAAHAFIRALRPGAPFAAAFMADSEGYTVDDRFFPAVAVGPSDVEDCLSVVADRVVIQMVETKSPLRRGYGGMILAMGVAR
ncbi:hypothetical protein Cs7R123_31700 [Catellatospora sp. TT07R-123]|uniref:SCO2525 family SAM-dependent methyltransferase n=1 Tax=Catellatospora sp. TT07R-123 TaxID=2733863 RepID=UPI001B212D3D|nr:SCO2525 family SAM-dependent methyltransferase [Catellatospora sp. TT07R-123]GHJ45828.1 hypothetical protein Cs7R123_31700 [Catellatospora sp. TT07R-123]